MTAEPITLALVAGLDADAKGALLTKDEIAKAGQLATDALGKLGALAAGLKDFDVLDSIMRALAREMRMPIADLLREGWKQDQQLRDALKSGKQAGTTRGEVKLHSHTVAVTLKPSATLFVNGAKGPSLDFEVKLSVLIESLKALVENATITALKAGKLTATLELSYLGAPENAPTRYPLMAPKKKEFDAVLQFPLPAGGLRIV